MGVALSGTLVPFKTTSALSASTATTAATTVKVFTFSKGKRGGLRRKVGRAKVGRTSWFTITFGRRTSADLISKFGDKVFRDVGDS